MNNIEITLRNLKDTGYSVVYLPNKKNAISCEAVTIAIKNNKVTATKYLELFDRSFWDGSRINLESKSVERICFKDLRESDIIELFSLLIVSSLENLMVYVPTQTPVEDIKNNDALVPVIKVCTNMLSFDFARLMSIDNNNLDVIQEILLNELTVSKPELNEYTLEDFLNIFYVFKQNYEYIKNIKSHNLDELLEMLKTR